MFQDQLDIAEWKTEDEWFKIWGEKRIPVVISNRREYRNFTRYKDETLFIEVPCTLIKELKHYSGLVFITEDAMDNMISSILDEFFENDNLSIVII